MPPDLRKRQPPLNTTEHRDDPRATARGLRAPTPPASAPAALDPPLPPALKCSATPLRSVACALDPSGLAALTGQLPPGNPTPARAGCDESGLIRRARRATHRAGVTWQAMKGVGEGQRHRLQDPGAGRLAHRTMPQPTLRRHGGGTTTCDTPVRRDTAGTDRRSEPGRPAAGGHGRQVNERGQTQRRTAQLPTLRLAIAFPASDQPRERPP